MRGYNLTDLVNAYLDVKDPRHSSSDYHIRKMTALSQSFGLVLRDETFEQRCLLKLMESAARSYHASRSPFQGFYEAPRAIHSLYKDHGVGLSVARDQLQEKNFRLIMDIFKTLYGNFKSHVTSLDLKEHGFDDTEEFEEED